MSGTSSGHSKWAGAVTLSLVLHTALSMLVHHRPASAATNPVIAEPEHVRDAMVGDTLELLTDVVLEAQGTSGAQVVVPVEPPPSVAPQAPVSERHDAPLPATPKHDEKPSSATSVPTAPAGAESPVREAPPKPRAPRPTPKPASSAAQSVNSKHKAASEGAASATSASAGAGVTDSFGTAGQPAVRHLGRAFTHAIMPVGMIDTSWNQLPAGDGGTLELVLRVDDDGKIAGFDPVGEHPPAHLMKLVKNVLWTLKSGRFAFDGQQPSAGRQTLKLHAQLSDVDADSIQGGRIDAGYSFSGTRGVAPFTLHGGRHVEIRVQVLKLEH